MSEVLATPYAHLSPSYRAAADLPDADRIRMIQAGDWIPYPRAKAVLQQMEDLLDHPKITRMPNMLLVAPSFNGKTSILDYFLKKHPPIVNAEAEATECPVIFIEAPSKPDIKDFYTQILRAIGAPFKFSGSTLERATQVKTLMTALKVRMLIIDEIHHVIAGGLLKQQEFRNAIKSLGNELKITIVAAGVEQAVNAFNTDPQMSSRFPPTFLPKWTQDKEYGQVLATLEFRTPLRKPSNLKDTALARAILLRSEGTLGDICDLVKHAAIDAIRKETEQITVGQIEKLNWAAPSARRRVPIT